MERIATQMARVELRLQSQVAAASMTELTALWTARLPMLSAEGETTPPQSLVNSALAALATLDQQHARSAALIRQLAGP